MPRGARQPTSVPPLEAGVTQLVRIAGAIAGASEQEMRAVMVDALNSVDGFSVEEIILQSYLFAGFPRALNAARAWRAVSGRPAPRQDPEGGTTDLGSWRTRGEKTCAVVYGDSYEKLRQNIRDLHPALDEWMIVDGYGKVLSRPGVDLRTRELCVVAACAVAGQQRQLHSHLHGALNAGASGEEIGAVLEAIADLVSGDELARYRQLLTKVQSGAAS
ncbi:MAG: carboxymuconolactone decarboxylase family protein [Gemmatimonadaceae bacterium]